MKFLIKSIAIIFMYAGFYQTAYAMNPAQKFLKTHVASQPHIVLGIAPNASENEINKAFRTLSLKWHPDKNLAFKEDAQEVFKKLSEAKEAMLKGESAKECSRAQSTPAQSAAAPKPAQPTQSSINDKKIKKILDSIRNLIFTVGKKKDDINKAIKAKLDLTDLILTFASNNRKTLAAAIIDFWNEFKILVDSSIEIKQLGKVPGKQIVDLVKDYAQFLRIVGNNPALNYLEKERKEINIALDQTINRYEKAFGKIDLTLTPEQKEQIERAQGTFKMSVEEQADPSLFKGTNVRMQMFFKQDLDKVLARISNNQNPYTELNDMVSGFRATIENVIALAHVVKQQNKTMTEPQKYVKWVKAQSVLLDSIINELKVKLLGDQRTQLKAELAKCVQRFDENFTK